MNKMSILILATACNFAVTGAAAAAGDAEAGQQKVATCLGCHGIPDLNNAYPTYKVPKLGGQHPEYILSALKAYRDGRRSHSTMNAQAQSLSDQDMADIAEYFARHAAQP